MKTILRLTLQVLLFALFQQGVFAQTPTVEFDAVQSNINEISGSVTVNLQVSNPNSQPVVVQIYTQGVSSLDTSSYYLPVSTVVFPAGSSNLQPLTIMLDDNQIAEQTRFLSMRIVPSFNAQVGADSIMTIFVHDNERALPNATNELALQLLTSHSLGAGSHSANAVTFNPATNYLYVANTVANQLDLVDISNPSTPIPVSQISMASYGKISWVATRDSIVAVALLSSVSDQDSGAVAFFDLNGNFQKTLKVGPAPSMITFNRNDSIIKAVIACEGYPDPFYNNDPDGTVAIITFSDSIPIPSLTQANVAFVNFALQNPNLVVLRNSGVHLFGPNATVAQDLEPEHVAIDSSDMIAIVSLQENNAIMRINISTNSILGIHALGHKNHSIFPNGLDASSSTPWTNPVNYPKLWGMYQPSGIAIINHNGQQLLLTANEGAPRDLVTFKESERVDSLVLDSIFDQYDGIQQDRYLGELLVSKFRGDLNNDSDFDSLFSFGGRSFSIRSANNGGLIYDSGDEFEQFLHITAPYDQLFNSGNQAIQQKETSSLNGPAPAGVATVQFGNQAYALVTLHQTGGVMLYNITDVNAPYFVSYHNNRSALTNGPDRGARDLVVIPDSLSPNGKALTAVANVSSGTITIYQLDHCQESSNLSVSISGNQTCGIDTVTLTAVADPGVLFQWYLNDSLLSGQNNAMLEATSAGAYTLRYTNPGLGCSGVTDTFDIDPFGLGTIIITASPDTIICEGHHMTLTATGLTNPVWDTVVTNGVPFIVTGPATYTVSGLDDNGCAGTKSINISTIPSPNPQITYSNGTLSTTTTFPNYQWLLNGAAITGANSQTYTPIPTAIGFYSVKVFAINGCFGISNQIYTNISSISESEEPLSFEVFPNPANDFLDLTFGERTQGRISVVSLTGQVLQTTIISETDKARINVSDLSSGMYLIVFENEEVREIGKISKL